MDETRIEYGSQAFRHLLTKIATAASGESDISLALSGDTVKIKIGGGMWSPPMSVKAE